MIKTTGMIDYEKKVRQCTKCKEIKDFDLFPKTWDDKPRSHCKACKNLYDRKNKHRYAHKKEK